MTTAETQVLDPQVAGPEGLPDKNHIALETNPTEDRDEQQAREAAKLRPEREAKFSDYYVGIPPKHLSIIYLPFPVLDKALLLYWSPMLMNLPKLSASFLTPQHGITHSWPWRALPL
jgi:hypothetical protein